VTYKRNPQKYCSISCGISARNKTTHNPSYSRDITGEKNPMFGKGLIGKANGMYGKRGKETPSWRGGRKIRKDGYVLVLAPKEHPHTLSAGKKSSTKYILEHRLIMEQYLGRYLETSEIVHHKDHNPSNNTIDNLELVLDQSEHIRKHHNNRIRATLP
jgi:hypothetical protein